METSVYDEIGRLENKNWFFIGKKHIIKSILENMKLKPHKYLDIGCGTGSNMEVLNEFASGQGIDLSQKAISICKSKGFNVIKANVEKRLPFKDDMFDLILCSDILEHVNDEKALKNIMRALKPGGIVIITVPAFGFLEHTNDRLGHHKRRYTKTSLLKLVNGNGRHVLKISYWNFFIFIPALVQITFQRIFNSKKETLNLGPAFLNNTLLSLIKAESFLLRYINFPWGVDLICVFRKI